jgi:hypothetical protein
MVVVIIVVMRLMRIMDVMCSVIVIVCRLPILVKVFALLSQRFFTFNPICHTIRLSQFSGLIRGASSGHNLYPRVFGHNKN